VPTKERDFDEGRLRVMLWTAVHQAAWSDTGAPVVPHDLRVHLPLCKSGGSILRVLAGGLTVLTCLAQAYIYATTNSYGADNWQKCLTAGNTGNLHRVRR
jgi:hypothetical protein